MSQGDEDSACTRVSISCYGVAFRFKYLRLWLTSPSRAENSEGWHHVSIGRGVGEVPS